MHRRHWGLDASSGERSGDGDMRRVGNSRSGGRGGRVDVAGVRRNVVLLLQVLVRAVDD